jgi:hypothetical protein
VLPGFSSANSQLSSALVYFLLSPDAFGLLFVTVTVQIGFVTQQASRLQQNHKRLGQVTESSSVWTELQRPCGLLLLL